MFILRIDQLIFKGSDNHTVGYRRNALRFLTGSDAKDDKYDISQVISANSGNFKWVVADTYENALLIMRDQLTNYIGTISWLNADLNDFYFTELHTEDSNGQFWAPCKSFGYTYRVSDLKRS